MAHAHISHERVWSLYTRSYGDLSTEFDESSILYSYIVQIYVGFVWLCMTVLSRVS